MNNCTKFNNFILNYDDLDKQSEKELNKHIKECADCKRKLDAVLMTKNVLNNVPEIELPQNFSEEFHKRLKEEKPAPKFRFNYRPLVSLAAVVIFAFALKTGYFQNQSNIVKENTVPTKQPMYQNTEISDINKEPEKTPTQNDTEVKKAEKTQSENSKWVKTREKIEPEVKNNEVTANMTTEANNTEKTEKEVLPSVQSQADDSENKLMVQSEDNADTKARSVTPMLTLVFVSTVSVKVSNANFDKATKLFDDSIYQITDVTKMLEENNISYQLDNPDHVTEAYVEVVSE